MDNPSLSNAIMDCITDHFAKGENPAIVTSFVIVAEAMRQDGSVAAVVCYPDDQAMSRSLGLIGYGEEWVRDDVRQSFLAAFELPGDDEL